MRENKIRILHVAQAAGGVDCYIRMLLKYLDKEKFENIMVCSQDFRKEDYNRLADHFEQIEMTRAIGVNDLKVIKAVRKLIKKYNPDIVYAHSSKAGAVARVANIGIKNYCIYNPHGWAFNMKCSAKKKAMYTAIEKVAALFCDKIICISDAEEKSALEKKICREEKLQVILNGVDIEAYENGVHGTVTRRDLDIPKDAFVVGMVGRICPQKAPDIFVRMANQVRNKVPNAHFIIVGNGNQEAEIRKYAEKNGFSDSLHITGWVDNPMNYVELFDVACLLSRWEGWLIVLTVVMCGSWMLISGGRIAIIRLLISIVLCMALKTSTKRKIAKLFSNIRFVAVFAVACAAFVYLTVLKGFEPLFNIYSDFAIQPKMFQYWGKEIAGQYAYGAASLFGFIYPFLYLIKNLFGLSKLPLGSNVYANIDKTFNDWITLGTYYRCNAYSSCFWYLYYDGRTIGIIIGMLLWGIFCKSIFSRMLECFDKKHISIYILMMIGVIYSFTDMEFSKANYVLAFLFISKVCFCKTKIVFGKTGGKKIE